ncbi:cell division protein ZapE [Nocardia neocaledoniensis]|uniref:cell division protein ZapE n=1 Tax=Nocardia neocaledoniensis TaxID=236511 RepID=UPI002455BC02|nr:cell division protein ZapE [Nocardia neocaledoniensis]
MTVVLDPAQAAAAGRLAELLDRHGRPRRRGRGVYLHGRPGRGKTMVMDRFFATADPKHKRRFHFHAFFAELHSAAHTLGSIEQAIESLLGTADLVCFDEFHVNDIGDGMLIARLLDALFTQRRTLVVTSNQAPRELLPNPLFHDRFVPSIERILTHLDVVTLDGPLDYRTLGVAHGSGFGSGAYVLDPASSPGGDIAIDLGDGRSVAALAVDADAVTFAFADLCGAPTSAADYLRLARRFRRWTLRAVPRLREVPPDQAMRLVNLIDVLYDADLPCTVHAAAPLAELTAGVPAVPDLARTASRLSETSHIADTAIRTV